MLKGSYWNPERSLENCKKDYISHLTGLKEERPGMDKLVSYLTKKTDFFTAPACETGLGACEGGLLRNSLNVMSRMCMEIGADATETGEDVNALLDSVTVVSLLSGIWKANYYRPVMKQKKDEKGKEVEYVAYYRPKPPEERLCFGKDDDHGDEAVYSATCS